MTARLTELLTEIAEDSPQFDVVERAIAGARRRRRLAVALPAAVVLVLVASVAFWAVRLPHDRVEEPAAGALTWLPIRVPDPDDRAPLLPATPVGAAAALYSGCAARCQQYLLTAGGAVYRLPAKDAPSLAEYTALAADGTRVIYRDGAHYVVRELTGDATHQVPAGNWRIRDW